MTDPPPKPPSRSGGLPRWLIALLVGGAVVGTLAGAGFGLVYDSFTVKSGSMWPGIPGETRVLAKRDKRAPQRGSLVVFKYPEHREQSFAKRVIGSAGDVVEQDAEGALSINGWKIPRCMVGKGAFTDPSTTGVAGREQHQGTLYVEWLGAWTHLVFEDESAPASAPHRWTVAEGQYFVVGDNRRNSHDSRTWYGGEGGGVPYADTIGIVQGHGGVALPANLRGNEKLEAGLSACLAKQPDAASPPAQ